MVAIVVGWMVGVFFCILYFVWNVLVGGGVESVGRCCGPFVKRNELN